MLNGDNSHYAPSPKYSCNTHSCPSTSKFGGAKLKKLKYILYVMYIRYSHTLYMYIFKNFNILLGERRWELGVTFQQLAPKRRKH